MKTRILSLFLIAALLAGMLAMPASAATKSEVYQWLKKEALDNFHDTENGYYYSGIYVDKEKSIYFGDFYYPSDGTVELTLVSDNSYPGLPHDAIVYSSAATDETQTNWNGVLGYIRLRVERPVFLDAVRVYPRGDAVWVKAVVSAASPFRGTLKLRSAALARDFIILYM